MPLVYLTDVQSKEDSLNISAHASKISGLGIGTSCKVYWMQILLWSCKRCGNLVKYLHLTSNVNVVHHLPLFVQVKLGYNCCILVESRF
jgi:hypothetical protein